MSVADTTPQRFPEVTSRFRSIAVLLTLPLAMLAAGAIAGPVQVGEADGSQATSELPATPPTFSVRPPPESLAPVLAASSAASTPGNADAASLAAELMKEAEADATTLEQPRKPKNQSVNQSVLPKPVARQPSAADDYWGLREMGKAAMHWINDTLPWLRSDEGQGAGGESVDLDQTGFGASPFSAGDPARQGANVGDTQLPGVIRAGSMDPAAVVGYGESVTAKQSGPDDNIVRKTIKILREVVEHPMTWLVISLFVIGGIVVKKIDRRPTR